MTVKLMHFDELLCSPGAMAPLARYWPWFRLRKETPSKYESYVDLMPGVWTKVRIDVRGERARLYVHDQQQPTLIVNDLKSGAQGKGAVSLWLDRGTVAHFRNLTVQPSSDTKEMR